MKLTDSFLRNLKPTDKDQKHSDGGGLYIYVAASTGAKLWRMGYRFNGKQKTLSFGPYPTLTLREAREKREEARKLLLQDIDPGAHKQAVKAARLAETANSFEVVAREWHATHTVNFTEKHRAKILYRLEKLLFPHIGKSPIADLEAQAILVPVRNCERQGHNETAHRLVQLCGQVFRYAIATGRAKHNIAADLKDALQPVKTRHMASITAPDKVGILLRALDGYEGYFQVQCALRIAPYVFLRPGELRQAEWAELDTQAEELRIPAHKMKLRTIHIVPLSKQVLSIIEKLRPFVQDEFIEKQLMFEKRCNHLI